MTRDLVSRFGSGSVLDLYSAALGIRIRDLYSKCRSWIRIQQLYFEMFQFQLEVVLTYKLIVLLHFKIVFEDYKGLSSKLFLLCNLRKDWS